MQLRKIPLSPLCTQRCRADGLARRHAGCQSNTFYSSALAYPLPFVLQQVHQRHASWCVFFLLNDEAILWQYMTKCITCVCTRFHIYFRTYLVLRFFLNGKKKPLMYMHWQHYCVKCPGRWLVVHFISMLYWSSSALVCLCMRANGSLSGSFAGPRLNQSS